MLKLLSVLKNVDKKIYTGKNVAKNNIKELPFHFFLYANLLIVLIWGLLCDACLCSLRLFRILKSNIQTRF